MHDSIDVEHLGNCQKHIQGSHPAVTRSIVELLWQLIWKLLFI